MAKKKKKEKRKKKDKNAFDVFYVCRHTQGAKQEQERERERVPGLCWGAVSGSMSTRDPTRPATAVPISGPSFRPTETDFGIGMGGRREQPPTTHHRGGRALLR